MIIFIHIHVFVDTVTVCDDQCFSLCLSKVRKCRMLRAQARAVAAELRKDEQGE